MSFNTPPMRGITASPGTFALSALLAIDPFSDPTDPLPAAFAPSSAVRKRPREEEQEEDVLERLFKKPRCLPTLEEEINDIQTIIDNILILHPSQRCDQAHELQKTLFKRFVEKRPKGCTLINAATSLVLACKHVHDKFYDSTIHILYQRCGCYLNAEQKLKTELLFLQTIEWQIETLPPTPLPPLFREPRYKTTFDAMRRTR